jgi:hypothetical protein
MSYGNSLMKLIQSVTDDTNVLTTVLNVKNAKRYLLCDIVNVYGITSDIRKVFAPWVLLDSSDCTLQQQKFIMDSSGGLGLFVLSTQVYTSIQFYLRVNNRMICITNEAQSQATSFVIFEHDARKNNKWNLWTLDGKYVFEKNDIPVSIDVLFQKCEFKELETKEIAEELLDFSLVPQMMKNAPVLKEPQVIDFYRGTKSANTNILQVLWSETLNNWLEIVKYTLPLPFENNLQINQQDTFQHKYGPLYTQCLRRVLEFLGVTYTKEPKFLQRSSVIDAPQVAESVVSSMIFILEEPNFVREVSKVLHAEYFPTKSLELLVQQIQTQKGSSSKTSGRTLGTSGRALHRIIPELDIYRLSQLHASQHECMSTSLHFVVTSKLMLVALQQYIFPDFEYAGDLYVPHLLPRSEYEYQRKNSSLERKEKRFSQEANKRINRKNKYIPFLEKPEKNEVSPYPPQFLEEVFESYTDHPTMDTKPWVIVLTVQRKNKVFRRVALIIRHDIKVIFLFDPCRDLSVHQYVTTILKKEFLMYSEYKTIIVVRQNMLDELLCKPNTTRYCSEWIPLFIVTACTGTNEEEILQRTMSRFNAEVRYLTEVVQKMESRLFGYVSLVMKKYQEIMTQQIKDHFPTIISEYSS